MPPTTTIAMGRSPSRSWTVISGDFTPGPLQEYLEIYLYLRQLELGLIPFPDPRDE